MRAGLIRSIRAPESGSRMRATRQVMKNSSNNSSSSNDGGDSEERREFTVFGCLRWLARVVLSDRNSAACFMHGTISFYLNQFRSKQYRRKTFLLLSFYLFHWLWTLTVEANISRAHAGISLRQSAIYCVNIYPQLTSHSQFFNTEHAIADFAECSKLKSNSQCNDSIDALSLPASSWEHWAFTIIRTVQCIGMNGCGYSAFSSAQRTGVWRAREKRRHWKLPQLFVVDKWNQPLCTDFGQPIELGTIGISFLILIYRFSV